MCARFEQNAPPGDLEKRFGLDVPPPTPNQLELRPTDLALVIASDATKLLTWGLSVDWDSMPIINARGESLTQKKTFRDLLENRCLVPATAYFEWRRDGSGNHKNRIETAIEDIFALAGIMDGDRFTIITCAPAPPIAHIHNRMPVILARAAEASWIDTAATFAFVSELLIPYKAGPLKAEEETPPPPRQPDLFG